jgi:tetratricopeptide (TPR) repeat protein
MGDKPTVEQIRADLEAGEGPHAVRLAKELAPSCDVDCMIELAGAFADHAIYAPLVDIWRRRLKKHALDEREKAPFANALNGMASEAMEERREDEALDLLAEAVELAPRLDYIRRNLAALLVHKGDFDGALIELDTLLSNSPTDPQANELMGVARYQSGDPQAALENLGVAFQAGSASAGLWLLKAQCLTGREAESIETLQSLHDDHFDRAASMIELELAEPGSPLQSLHDVPRAKAILGELME